MSPSVPYTALKAFSTLNRCPCFIAVLQMPQKRRDMHALCCAGGEPDSKPQFRSMRSLLQQAGTVLPQPDLIAPLTDPTVLQQQPSAENAHDAVPKDEEQTAVDQLPSDNANGVDMQHDTEVQQDDGLADGAGLMPQPMQVGAAGAVFGTCSWCM